MKIVFASLGKGVIACALCLAQFHASLAKEKEPLVLSPSSKWNLNYADDSCKLARFFGTGDDRVAVIISRFESGNSFHLAVAGKPLTHFSADHITMAFGPDGGSLNRGFMAGSLGTFKPALFGSAAHLLKRDDNDETEDDNYNHEEHAAYTLRDLQAPPAADEEAAIQWLEVRQKARATVHIELGSMGQPMAAMRKCTDELMTHWGIDVAAHRQLANLPIPTKSPGKWLTSADYPSDLQAHGAQGIIQFRLSVDADGKPTQCHIQQSSRPAGFDRAVCKALMKRAQFEPAHTRDGKAIASYWRSTVKFVAGR